MKLRGAIALGAYVRGYPTDPAALDRYAALVGRAPAIVHVFRNWTDVSRDFDPRHADEVSAAGAALLISWQPPPESLATIAAGGHDEYVHAYARAVRSWGGELLLRFAHEMNGEWIPWRTDGPTYRAAWRRVHRAFGAEGALNVRWVWSPHVRDERAAAFEPYFPGADAVDWLALDGYNWGESQAGSGWATLDELFAGSYGELVALAPEAPVMLAEIGCAEDGGDKAAWIRDAFLRAIPAHYPAVRAVAWFHDRPRGHADWRVDSSTASLAAWREVVQHPLYSGRV